MAITSPLNIQPYEYIGDISGRPINDGQVFIGQPNKDPEFYPLQVYLDESLTQPIEQPIRTKGGFVSANGDFQSLYTNEALYSVKVLDKQGRKVLYRAKMLKGDIVSEVLTRLDAAIDEAIVLAELKVDRAVDAILADIAVDDNITVTPKYVGSVPRTQADVNAETVSLLDFGAPYSTDSTTHLQKALDYLNSVGGGVLTIPYHTGTLVINSAITLYENITVECADNLIIQCPGNTVPYMFRLEGSIDATEHPLTSNAKEGDLTLNFTPSLLVSKLDDLMLVSQRECAHRDAGEDWLLGDTTAGVASPHFAEPVIVTNVLSAGTITVQTPLMFPSYRTDKTLETSPTARATSTLQRINFKGNFKWRGGIFKRESRSLFYLIWTKDCSIECAFERGYGEGVEVTNTYSLRNFINIKVRRPSDWVMTGNHSSYNSTKDVSTWYTKIVLDEDSGSQGLDQTYKLYPSIYPDYTVTHTNSRESAMTTHGNCYGATINIVCHNAGNYAYYGRARFTTANVTAINCKGAIAVEVGGALDSVYNTYAHNTKYVGFRSNSKAITGQTPARKNTTVTGYIHMADSSEGDAVVFEENTDIGNKYAYSGIVLRDLKIRSVNRAINIGQFVHGVLFSNVEVTHAGAISPIYIRNSNTAKIRGLSVVMQGAAIQTPRLKAIFGSPLSALADVANYPNPAWQIDFATCSVVNGELLPDNIRNVITRLSLSGTPESTAYFRIDASYLAPKMYCYLTGGTGSDNRLVFGDGVPVGMEIAILITASSPTLQVSVYGHVGMDVAFLPSVTNLSNTRVITVANPIMLRMMKISPTEIIAY